MIDEFVLIETPDHGALEFELAGFGSRFSAHLVDALFIAVIILVISLGLTAVGALGHGGLHGLFEGGPASWAHSWMVAVLVMLIFLVIWGYFVFFECLMHGSTPGKRQLGIRVIRDDGLPIGFREAALRNLVRAADILPPPCYLLGAVVLFLDRHGRRLGDMVAGTLVVREKMDLGLTGASGAAWAARVEKGHSRQAVILPGGKLTLVQLDLVEQFLTRRHQLPPERRDALAWQITAPLLELCGEDRNLWESRPARTEECERFLLAIVELAKTVSQAAPAALPGEARPELF